MKSKIEWLKFSDLSARSLYEVMALRESVFVVEQNCAYQEIDGKDYDARHLLIWDDHSGRESLVAYCRILSAGVRFKEVAISRVVTHPRVRRSGFGKILMREAINRVSQELGHCPIRISAQAYLEKFYQSFGFETVSKPYLEDGIPHIEMLHSSSSINPY